MASVIAFTKYMVRNNFRGDWFGLLMFESGVCHCRGVCNAHSGSWRIRILVYTRADQEAYNKECSRPSGFLFSPFYSVWASAPMIEPLLFRVDFPSSFKSVGKCLPSHMQASLNPGKLSMKINHPQWLGRNPHCGRTLLCALMSCVPSIRTECSIPLKGSYI